MTEILTGALAVLIGLILAGIGLWKASEEE